MRGTFHRRVATLFPLHVRIRALCAVVALTALNLSFAGDEGDGSLQILGWVESAYLVAPGYEVRAKLDTGARTSSLDARIIKKFRQWGRRWVRFAVRNPETGEETVMVRERKRTIGIVQHEGDNDVRPTVIIEVCIAGQERDIEVSLKDRSNFNYPLLLGRRALRTFAVIDSSDTFLSDATCPEDYDPGRVLLDPSVTDPDERRMPKSEPDDTGEEAENRASET